MNGAPRLLVVDDEQVVCQSCTRIFESEGFEVETTMDSREGLRLATDEEYAAILLDIRIPGMDGLEFLDRLRQKNTKVPVIVITGYSSVQSAAAAMRFSAADYIPKPFTPEEITTAVRRIIPKKEKVVIEKAQVTPAVTKVGAWQAQSEERLFVDESWLTRGKDGTVRVGSFVSADEAKDVVSVTLPRVGDKLVRGLPLAALNGPGQSQRLLVAPLAGEVIEVNRALAESPAVLFDDPCTGGWIARVRPAELDADLQAARPRRVLLANAQEGAAMKQEALFAGMGCEVTLVKELDDVLVRLQETGAHLLVINAQSYGDRGPRLARRVREAAPDVKVVVVGDPTGKLEAAFREHRIHYYAVEPLVGQELAEVLCTAFKPATKPALAPMTSAIPLWIGRVRLTNRHGQKVSLMATRGLIRERDGLGQTLVKTILDASYPVTIGLGNEPLSSLHLRQEAENCDRLLVLQAQDDGKLPGSLTHDVPSEIAESAGESVCQKLATLGVQPPAAEGRQLTFDVRTTEALAQQILKEMIAAPL
jgi:CheY-like chemotaxis protein